MKRKSFFSKCIVVFVICANITFTAAILYIYLLKGSEPTSLIAAWFAFTTAELLSLTKIKTVKEQKEE